jgi:acetate kinase
MGAGNRSVNGVPVATTMGFTPMDGLMMGTRPGSVDPGILLHVLKHRGLNVDELDEKLNHGSGLLGVSGVSSDFRKVEASARQGNDRARLALEIYAGRIREAVGALAVTMGGSIPLSLRPGSARTPHPPFLRMRRP